MRVNQAYRYELDPKDGQRTLLARHTGAARFAYNRGLARRIELFQRNSGKAKFTDAVEQHRELNRLKKTDFSWMYETSKCAVQEALRNPDAAFKNFWMGRNKGRRVGFPKFRKKGVNDGFRLTGVIGVFPKAVQLPRIGWIRVKEQTDVKGRILSATVKREADPWYVSLDVERERPDPKPVKRPVIGVDLGLDAFAAGSDGTSLQAPKPLAHKIDLLRRGSRQHSRKQRGSNNRRKSAIRLGRLHRKIRTDAIQVGDRRGGLVRPEHDAQPPPGAGDFRRGMGRIPQLARLQDALVRVGDCRRAEGFFLDAALFEVRDRRPASRFILPHLPVRVVRVRVRSGPGRGEELGVVRPVRPEPGESPNACGESSVGGMNPRRGAVYETWLAEAGSKLHLS